MKRHQLLGLTENFVVGVSLEYINYLVCTNLRRTISSLSTGALITCPVYLCPLIDVTTKKLGLMSIIFLFHLANKQITKLYSWFWLVILMLRFWSTRLRTWGTLCIEEKLRTSVSDIRNNSFMFLLFQRVTGHICFGHVTRETPFYGIKLWFSERKEPRD